MKTITVYNLDNDSEMTFCNMSKTRALINACLIDSGMTNALHDNNVYNEMQRKIRIGEYYMMLGAYSVRI